jgi:thiamine-phosphate diphosphorylase
MHRYRLRSRLYVITPVALAGTDELITFVQTLVAAGVGMIQYRAKGLSTRAMIEDCARLVLITRRAGVPLIVNDRVDVALAVGADGVHVGPDDMPVAYARRLLGPHALVGATAPQPHLARQAEQGGASYVAVGPMFATPTAPDKSPLGPEAIAPVRAAVRLPICAIGGIKEQNLAAVAAAGADLVAVVGAVATAAEPGLAARRLVEQIRAWWGEEMIGL